MFWDGHNIFNWCVLSRRQRVRHITYLSHWETYQWYKQRNKGLKKVLRTIAIDLGLAPEDGDKDIVALMELLFGRAIVHEWQLDGLDEEDVYSLSNIVIGELNLEDEQGR